MTAILGLLGAALVAVALAEAAARRWLRRGGAYYVWPPGYRRHLSLDRLTHPQLEPQVRFEINSDGERAPECPNGDPGLFRMLVVGGSAVECALNDQDSCWTSRLRGLLGRPDALRALGATSVHVGNIGRSGMDVRAVDLILQRILPRYDRLDAIALMVGPGDIVRWIEAGAEARATAPPLAVGACFSEHCEERFAASPARLALTELLRRARRRLWHPVDAWQSAGKWMGRARAMRRNAREMRTSAADPTAMLDLFEAYLRMAVGRAQSAARHVVLLRQPIFRKARFTPEEEALIWNGGVGNAFRGDDVSVFYSNQVIFELADRVEERIRSVAADVRIPYVDTMQRLPTTPESFFDHFHLTAAGNAVVADTLASELVGVLARPAPQPQRPARDDSADPHPFFVTAERPTGPRLLLVSHHFPPGSSAGALRWQKLACFVAERGWGLDVLALDPADVERQDYSRLADLPAGTRVYGIARPTLNAERIEHALWRIYVGLRPKGPKRSAPGSLSRAEAARHGLGPRDAFRAYTAWFEFARGKRWAREAARAATRVADPAGYLAVVTCGPPHTAHLAGARIARASGIPHVMDLRDPWSLVQRVPESFASPVWWWLAARNERRVVPGTALIVANTEKVCQAMQARYPEAAGRVIAVLNGYDDDPMPVSRPASRFTVGYCGSIYLDRDPSPLFRAAAALARELRLRPDQFGIDLMGDVSEFDGRSVADLALEAGIPSLVRLVPTQPRHKMLEFMADAAVLVSLPQDSDLAIPSKIYEYMQFDAWLLALAERGSATEMLLRDTGADVVAPNDEAGIAAVLRRCYLEHARGARPTRIAAEQRFSRREQARALLDAIETVRGNGHAPGGPPPAVPR